MLRLFFPALYNNCLCTFLLKEKYPRLTDASRAGKVQERTLPGGRYTARSFIRLD
jgi:hypothetical protein